VEEADAVLLIVDGREGLSSTDTEIAERLRRANRRTHLVVNKTENLDAVMAVADSQIFGFGEAIPISAAHNRGIAKLMDLVLEPFETRNGADVEGPADSDSIRLAIVGRPNVGKSTFVNRLLGEERVLAFDSPGTTRDTVAVPLVRDGVDYTLIDTAGLRRRARVEGVAEKFSVVKTLKAIEGAHVAVLMLDARASVSDQDAHLLGFVADSGRALVIAVNKWDGLSSETRQTVRADLARRLSFLDFARIHYVSALHGSGIKAVMDSVKEAHAAAQQALSTPALTRTLEAAVRAHPPPVVRGRRIKLRYAHQGGRNPPVIVVHGTQTGSLPAAYARYLTKTFREAFGLRGTPVRVEFRSGANPYAASKRRGPRRPAR